MPTLPACIFCDRDAGDVAYAWPGWLCELLTDRQRIWNAEHVEVGSTWAIAERMEREVDKTVADVCTTCRQGWMQRLDDNVSPFLRAIVLGEPTALPPARRKLLARWAATTSVVLERAIATPVHTPRFACEHLRKIGPHAGTQVLVGRYGGRAQVLTYERDLFSRVVDGEKRYVAQSSFVMGKVLVQVFADPWRETPPALTEAATHPFISLIGAQGSAAWPPSISVDDTVYDAVRGGPIEPASRVS